MYDLPQCANRSIQRQKLEFNEVIELHMVHVIRKVGIHLARNFCLEKIPQVGAGIKLSLFGISSIIFGDKYLFFHKLI